MLRQDPVLSINQEGRSMSGPVFFKAQKFSYELFRGASGEEEDTQRRERDGSG